MLDTHQLNVFLIAAETLNFTQAAQRLHMTQPSVSQHIQALERHFDLQLFLRAGRHIELTDAGMRLVPLARDLVARSVNIEEVMESLKGEVYGHLRVGCSTTPGKYVLPQLLTQFHNEHSKVKVTCQVSSQNHTLEMLFTNEVHIALTSLPQVDFKEGEFRKFMTDEVVLIAPLDHPWAIRGEIEPKDLLDGEFIFREAESGTQTAVRQGLKKIGVNENDLSVILTLGNSEALALAVQEGLGVGFVSNLVLVRLVRDKVAPICVKGLRIEREIYIGRYTNRPFTTAQTAFWEFISTLDRSFIEHLTGEAKLPAMLPAR